MPKKESEPRDAAMMLVQQIRDGKPLAIYGADPITESEATGLRQHPNLDEHLVRFVIQKRKETVDRRERERVTRQAREAADRAERERKRRAVDVVRISIDEKRKEQRGSFGHSKDTQHSINQEKMARLGYDLAREYGAAFVVDRIPTTEPKPLAKKYPGAFVDDGGPSWAVSERLRPALWSLILGLHEKRIKIDAVFVYEPGRLARDPDLFGKLYRLFTQGFGVELVIEGQPVNDDNLGGILHRLEGDIQTVERTRKKTNDTLSRLREDGQVLGRPPIGLLRSRDGLSFEVDPAVQFVIDQHAAGTPRAEIAKRFPDYRSPGAVKARKLSHGGIDRILRNVKALQGGTLEDVLAPHRLGRSAKTALYRSLELQDRKAFDTWFEANYPKLFYRLN